MGKLKKKILRLKADSLLETVVAAVLIVIIFGIAMMIYSNVIRSSLSVKQLQAASLLEEAAAEITNTRSITTGSVRKGDFTIYFSAMPWDETRKSLKLHLAATDAKGDTVAIINKLILSDEN